MPRIHFKLSTRLMAGTAILAASALPAFAQDLCGGVGVNGQWIGGTEAGSDITSAPDYMEQMALVLMNNEYVALFNVTAPTTVRLEAEGRGGGDPVMDLRNAGGEILLSDDDSGGNSAALAQTMLNPGTYCLSMKSYSGGPMTGFVRVSRPEQAALTMMGMAGGDITDPGLPQVTDPDSYMPGGGCGALSNYIGDGPIDTSLAGAGASVTAPVAQVDAWGFSLAAPQAITITAENEAADPIITLYDGFGNYLAENDDYDGLNSRLEMTPALPAGDYCIEMRALSDDMQPVTVSVMQFDPMAAMATMINAGEASPPMDGSWPITDLGPLDTRLRQDPQVGGDAVWYQFEMTEGGLVVIEAVAGGMGDPVIYLYDDFGRMVTMNDDNGQGLDSMIAARVLPGTYLLGVKQFDADQAGLVRMLFERFVPAR